MPRRTTSPTPFQRVQPGICRLQDSDEPQSMHQRALNEVSPNSEETLKRGHAELSACQYGAFCNNSAAPCVPRINA